MSWTDANSPLAELARLHGIQLQWKHAGGENRLVSPETVRALLATMGVSAGTEAEASHALHEARAAKLACQLPPVVVAWDGQPGPWPVCLPTGSAAAHLTVQLELEDGSEQSWKLSPQQLPAVDQQGNVPLSLPLDGPLPFGRHRLHLEYHGVRGCCWILSAPRAAWPGIPSFTAEAGGSPAADRSPTRGIPRRAQWGVFLPLYSLITESSWGAGNYTDLARLAAWCGAQGGALTGTLPLLASSLGDPCDPSPYAPFSRLFWNEFHIDIPAIPEFARSQAAQQLVASEEFQQRLAEHRSTDLIDWKQQMQLRRQVLEILAVEFFESAEEYRRTQFLEYLAQRPEAGDYAAFRAAGEQLGTDWQQWPADLRNGTLPESCGDPSVRQFWLYSQWIAEQQMAAASAEADRTGSGLYLDLPLGVRQNGFDLWRHQSVWAIGTQVGAPPDPVFTRGQNWGFAPLDPRGLRQDGYSYLLEVIGHHLRYSRLLRIDHVMSLHRLWWIPPGFSAADGAYVGCPGEELTAVLCLMSHRHQATIVGENLGTVPVEVDESLKRHAIRTMHVLQYELEGGAESGLKPPPHPVLASLNTHDMPPFAGWWAGLDIDDRLDLGLMTAEEAVEERRRRAVLVAQLSRQLREQGWSGTESGGQDRAAAAETAASRGVPPQDEHHSEGRAKEGPGRTDDVAPAPLAPPAEEDVTATHRFLAASPAESVLVSLEDLWRETRPQNVPGTSSERANWQRRAAYTFEEFSESPAVLGLLAEFNELRRQSLTVRESGEISA